MSTIIEEKMYFHFPWKTLNIFMVDGRMTPKVIDHVLHGLMLIENSRQKFVVALLIKNAVPWGLSIRCKKGASNPFNCKTRIFGITSH